ncbi:hypothetical protein JAAARDRAFT_57449 [Jaapia argillacea MUCL 33604]|uniref:Uncharacterized protein n=1 Tax=Jaapia argillacea MUCL 33604 TaxID=933084 RepID=A0A067Q4W7_9AGAM|nr:hypothetical protein JAAARDRAFT_57449 [Jaapia argillacea MUCL 33604]
MAKELAPEIKVPLLTRLLSIVYLLWVHFVSENIFVWSWIQGKRNIQADIVGPAYVLGAPNRQLEEGKAILATTAELKASIPCIVDIQVLDSDRKPIPHLSVDWWQARPVFLS